MPQKSTGISRVQFLASEKASVLRADLVAMTKDPTYNTRVISQIDTDPNYFVEKHMKYMSDHLTMAHSQYVMNLKMMTKLTSKV
jgi:hypothetical protein